MSARERENEEEGEEAEAEAEDEMREREEELQEHIQLIEEVERLEDELEATQQSLKLQSTQRERAEQALKEAEIQLAQQARAHEQELETLRRHHRQALNQAAAQTSRHHQALLQQVAFLQQKNAALLRELQGLQWTEARSAEVAVLDTEVVFSRLLVARTRPECAGLARRLNELLSTELQPAWLLHSAWQDRLCARLEETRGSPLVICALAHLSHIPAAALHLSSCNVFECLHDALALALEVDLRPLGNADKGHAAPATGARFQRSAAEWQEAFCDGALAMLGVLTGGHHPLPGPEQTASDGGLFSATHGGAVLPENVSNVRQFVAAPGALPSLLLLLDHATALYTDGPEVSRAGSPQLLHYLVEIMVRLCQAAPVDEAVASSLVAQGALRANLRLLRMPPPAQQAAISCLTWLTSSTLPHLTALLQADGVLVLLDVLSSLAVASLTSEVAKLPSSLSLAVTAARQGTPSQSSVSPPAPPLPLVASPTGPAETASTSPTLLLANTSHSNTSHHSAFSPLLGCLSLLAHLSVLDGFAETCSALDGFQVLSHILRDLDAKASMAPAVWQQVAAITINTLVLHKGSPAVSLIATQPLLTLAVLQQIQLQGGRTDPLLSRALDAAVVLLNHDPHVVARLPQRAWQSLGAILRESSRDSTGYKTAYVLHLAVRAERADILSLCNPELLEALRCLGTSAHREVRRWAAVAWHHLARRLWEARRDARLTEWMEADVQLMEQSLWALTDPAVETATGASSEAADDASSQQPLADSRVPGSPETPKPTEIAALPKADASDSRAGSLDLSLAWLWLMVLWSSRESSSLAAASATEDPNSKPEAMKKLQTMLAQVVLYWKRCRAGHRRASAAGGGTQLDSASLAEFASTVTALVEAGSLGQRSLGWLAPVWLELAGPPAQTSAGENPAVVKLLKNLDVAFDSIWQPAAVATALPVLQMLLPVMVRCSQCSDKAAGDYSRALLFRLPFAKAAATKVVGVGPTTETPEGVNEAVDSTGALEGVEAGSPAAAAAPTVSTRADVGAVPTLPATLTVPQALPSFIEQMIHDGALAVVAEQMQHDNQRFAAGSKIVAQALTVSDPQLAKEALRQTSLRLGLQILSAAQDMDVRTSVDRAFSTIFTDHALCLEVVSSGALAHVVALIETSPSMLQLRAATRILLQLAQWQDVVAAIVRYGALRVLCELYATLSRLRSAANSSRNRAVRAGHPGDGALPLAVGLEDSDADERWLDESDDGDEFMTAASADAPSWLDFDRPQNLHLISELVSETLLRVLDHAESVGAALSEDGQLGLLEELLEDATSSSEVLLSTLRCVAAVARSSSLARNLLDTQLPEQLLRFYHNRQLGGLFAEEVRQICRDALLNLAWHAGAAQNGGVSDAEVLHRLMRGGALSAFVEVVRTYGVAPIVDDEAAAQLLRQALWGITTWLTRPTLEMRSKFIRQQGLAALLEIDLERAPAEVQRFVRVSLSFVLGKTGEDLTTVTAVLRAHMQHHADVAGLWQQMADEIDQADQRRSLLQDEALNEDAPGTAGLNLQD